MSEINPFNDVDYLAEARSRVTEQFKDKDIFDRYLQLLISGRTDLEQVFKDLMQKRSLDTATGAQLDILGEIVGQSRTLTNIESIGFVGYGTDYGMFYGGVPKSLTLDDDSYRLFIRSKIAKNITKATPEDIMANANLIFNTTGSSVNYEGSAEYTLYIGKILTPIEKYFLSCVIQENGYITRLLPKPAGVRVNYGNFDSSNYFGYQGSLNVKGYGDLDNPSVGGRYAGLL